MNQDQYRKAFDQIPFSVDFQERTVSLLYSRTLETKQANIKRKWIRKPMIAAAVSMIQTKNPAFIWPAAPKLCWIWIRWNRSPSAAWRSPLR